MCGEVYHVCFTDTQKHWWSPFLKEGIKHCFVIKAYRQHFIIYARNTIGVELYTLSKINEIIEEGYLMRVESEGSKKGLFMLNTCVGHTKQILGISNPFIITPYQLYKHLEKRNGISKTEST